MSSPETLEQLVVTPQNIVDGFRHPELYDAYIDIAGEAINGKTAQELCQERGFSRSNPWDGYDLLRHRFAEWITNGRIPHTVRAVLALHQMGIFPTRAGSGHIDPKTHLINGEIAPFDSENPRFPLINLLNSCVFWRGNLNKRKSGSSSSAVCLNPKEQDPLLHRLVESVIHDVTLLDDERKLRLDALYARLFMALGAPDGKKCKETALPRYIELALNTLNRNSKASDEEKQRARHIIRDFVLSAFYVKKVDSKPSRSQYHLALPGSIHSDIAEERLSLFRDAVAKSQLDIAMRPKKATNQACYSYDVIFPDIDSFEVERFIVEFQGRIFAILDSAEQR